MICSYRSLFLVIVFLGTSILVRSQESDKLGSWYVYNGFYSFSPKFEIFGEAQLRTYEPMSNVQNFFIRAFFNYNVTPGFQLGLGQEFHNAWTFAQSGDDKTKTEEYRATLQGMLFHKIDRVSFQHRYRYEFRFLDHKGEQRTRYRLQLGIPINKMKMEKNTWFATCGNEFLINTAPDISLAQNRLYGMFGYQFSKSSHIQIGYMHIAQQNSDNLNRLQFFFTHKLNFSKNNRNQK